MNRTSTDNTRCRHPRRGHFAIFFVAACVLLAAVLTISRVVFPRRVPPMGEGCIYYKQDELTRFRVRQHSVLPLRLPHSADPAAQIPYPQENLPLQRAVPLLSLPPYRDTVPDTEGELPPEEIALPDPVPLPAAPPA